MKKEILCLDCGHYFLVSYGNIKKIKSKGYHIPTHCPTCRNIRWEEERARKRRVKRFERNKYDEKV